MRHRRRELWVLHWGLVIVTVTGASWTQFCILLDAFWSVLEANWTCLGAICKLLEPPWESFGPCQGGFRETVWFWVPKSFILDLFLASKIEETLVRISNINVSDFRHWLMVYFWLILSSKMKAVRRRCITFLSGMLNVFAHRELLKTTVNYSTFWRLSRMAKVFWKESVMRFIFKMSLFSCCARGSVEQVVLKPARGHFCKEFWGVNLVWFALKFKASVWALVWGLSGGWHPSSPSPPVKNLAGEPP